MSFSSTRSLSRALALLATRHSLLIFFFSSYFKVNQYKMIRFFSFFFFFIATGIIKYINSLSSS